MRKILLISMFCLIALSVLGQKTVLFLLPIGAEKAIQTDLQDIHTQQDIERIFDKSLIYFWEGAQIAINELREEGNDLRIIVRDISDAHRLDQALAALANQPIDLIIAPVYGKLFPSVAQFARQHKIPTINPFSSRSDIVEGNPYIYKVQPATDSRPAMLTRLFPNANFIVWTNPARATHDATAYTDYFSAHNVPFHTVTDTAKFDSYLSSTKKNVVVATFQNPTAFQNATTHLLQQTQLPGFSWVLPEEWLSLDEFNLENMTSFDIYYFAQTFIDKSAENVQSFINTFGNNFHALPATEYYAFQGYDITKFFISLIINDFTIPDFQPLGYRFQFERQPKGGFENQKARLFQLLNFKPQEIF